MKQDFKFIFDPEKNASLKEQRGVNFEDIIMAIENGQILEIRQHHNPSKYPNQKIMFLLINNYVFQVPFLQTNDSIILKTVFPSRKATAIYHKQVEYLK